MIHRASRGVNDGIRPAKSCEDGLDGTRYSSGRQNITVSA